MKISTPAFCITKKICDRILYLFVIYQTVFGNIFQNLQIALCPVMSHGKVQIKVITAVSWRCSRDLALVVADEAEHGNEQIYDVL